MCVIIFCGKHNTVPNVCVCVCVTHTMFAHVVRQPSSHSLFLHCAFESSISGARRMEVSRRTRCAYKVAWWCSRCHAIKMMGGPHPRHRLPDSWLTAVLGLSEALFQPLVPYKALTIHHNLYKQHRAKLCVQANVISFSLLLLCRRRALGMAKREGVPANRTAR